MRVIKYYDNINKKFIDVEVSDEVARFLHADRKRRQRQKIADLQNIAFSLDDKINKSTQHSLTYHEIIEDEKSNISKQLEKQEYLKTFWNVVFKLEQSKREFVILHYLYGRKLTELAERFNKQSSGNMSKWKNAVLNDLRILFNTDKDFVKTNYYLYNHYNKSGKNIIEIGKEMLENKSFKFNFNNILDFINSSTQIQKKQTQMNVEHNDSTWQALDAMKKVMRPFVKEQINCENKEFTISSLFESVIEKTVQEISGNKNLKPNRELKEKIESKLSEIDFLDILNLKNKK